MGFEANIATALDAVAHRVAEREALVWGDVRLTYAQFTARAHQLAHMLHAHGLGAHAEREQLAGHESGQDHLALYLYNGNEFLEANVGAYAARVAPFNVNFRYVDEELAYLLADAKATAIVYHSAFAPTLARVRDRLPQLRLLLQVADDSGHGLLDGAQWYEDAIAAQPTTPPPVTPSPDDLYVLYTGGTTGMPKGVLWRQADIFVAALGGISRVTNAEYESYDELAREAAEHGGLRAMPTAPFMHGAAQWAALHALTHGNTIVLPESVRGLDPVDVWETCEREHVNQMLFVGDAIGRPLLEELERGDYDVRDLLLVVSGGAVLSVGAKQRLLERLPNVLVVDGLGSSEAGVQGSHVSHAAGASTGLFSLGPTTRILSDDLTRVLEPGDTELGWLANTGRIPLGYLGDEAKTARTFPVVQGVRYVSPGDRARLVDETTFELLGRDSVTINTGGEKVFAEEVEQAILRHPAVRDVVVCGRPSERWGNEVVAVVSLRTGESATADELIACAGEVLARYKLPKGVVFRDVVVRSPAGKADYRWAREQALAG